MIQGLWIDMPVDRLRAHATVRAEFHKGKAKWYDGRAKDLLEGRGGDYAVNISNDPVESLKRSCSQHQQKATYFALLVEHLVPGETYRLGDNDLMRLEFYDGHF